MSPPKQFETARLILRVPCLDDANDIFRNYASDPEVTRFLMWRPHADISVTAEFLQSCIDDWSSNSDFTWAITLKESDEVIGMLSAGNDGFKTDIGYVLSRHHWGQGIMTEAASAVVHWAIEQPEIFRVWAFCDTENNSSAKVLQKIGLKRETVLQRWIMHPNVSSTPRDCIVYALVK